MAHRLRPRAVQQRPQHRPHATPTVVGGRIYANGITGFLTCIEAETGKQAWQVDCFKKPKAELPRFGVCCSPLVVGNKVIVAVGGKGRSVVAFETETGEVAWQGLDEPASASSPVLVVAGGKAGRLSEVAFMTALRVVGLNPPDGAVNWEFALPFQPGGTSPTPLVVGGRIVTGTMSNGSTAIKVTAGEKVTAEKEWQAKGLSGYFSSGSATKPLHETGRSRPGGKKTLSSPNGVRRYSPPWPRRSG